MHGHVRRALHRHVQLHLEGGPAGIIEPIINLFDQIKIKHAIRFQSQNESKSRTQINGPSTGDPG